MKKTKAFFGLIFVLLLGSCGLETYVYLNPVEIITINGVIGASVTLPSSQQPQFRNYMIYYRIYLANRSESTFATELQINNVNTVLYQHYKSLARYTSNDNVSSTAIGTVFGNLGYYSLFVSPDGTNGKPLGDVLNAPTGGTIWLDFTDSKIPSLEFPLGVLYELFRADKFENQSSRLFTYNDDLANSNTTNSDVQGKTGDDPVIGAYVSMYIVAFGIDENFSPVYSRPTHIGIFQLPK